MRPEVTINYNHADGAIEIRLPSGTRLGFKKESEGLVFTALNWAHSQPVARLQTPMTQTEVSRLTASWLAAGHTIIKPLGPAQPVDLEDLGL